jgi:hypothetical protein
VLLSTRLWGLYLEQCIRNKCTELAVEAGVHLEQRCSQIKSYWRKIVKFPLKYQLLGLTVALGVIASLPGRAIAQFDLDTPQMIQNDIEDRFMWGPHLYGTPPGRRSDSIQNMTPEEYRNQRESRQRRDTPSNRRSNASGDRGDALLSSADVFGRDANPNEPIARQIASVYPATTREKLEQLFSQMLTAYKEEAQQRGLSLNDIPFAMSTLVCTSYEVIHQQDVSGASCQAVSQQFSKFLASNATFNQLSEAQKQDFYDRLITQSMVIKYFSKDAESNNTPVSRSVVVEIATRSLEDLLNVPVSRVRVSEQGVSFGN